MKQIALFILLFVSIFPPKTNAQDSSRLRVSLITCGQGDELYSIFGHTAIRIIDSSNQTDIVYNYGTFDFNDPDFYMKFTRGRLDYMLSAYHFADFMSEYYAERRDVTEQVLQMPGDSKIKMRAALNETMAGPSRYYKYIFNYNNCTTRVRDLLEQYAGLKADQQLVPPNTTVRKMLYVYLDRGAQPWSKLGIDLLLGSPIDKKVTIAESMFLPDYLMKAVDSSVNSHNMLQSKKLIYDAGTFQRPNVNQPLYAFIAISVVLMMISLRDNKTAKSITRFFDVALFLLTGLLGCFLLFMWFGTDHKACAANYNLLWALPTNLIAAVTLWKKPRWLTKYFSFCVIIYLLTLIGWFFLPQQFNISLLPIVLLMLQRSWALKKATA